MFIGGTTLLTETYAPNESSKAQALNDFIIFTSATVASFSAGALHHTLGWEQVNFSVIPFIVLCLGALYGLKKHRTAVSLA